MELADVGARQKQARAEARLQPPAPVRAPLYLRPSGPVPPEWLLRYEAALQDGEVEPDDARDQAREDFGEECLAWVLRTRPDDVVRALWGAALDGAVSPLNALGGALFTPGPDDAHTAEYWAADALERLAQMHEYSLLEALPEAAQPLVKPLLPSYQPLPTPPDSTPDADAGA